MNTLISRVFFAGEWSCHCHQGWEGPDCSVRLETRCNDGYDDDQGKTNKNCVIICNLLIASPKATYICLGLVIKNCVSGQNKSLVLSVQFQYLGGK